MLIKISKIFVSLVLLISFTGFTVDLHYCKDKLYDVGILSAAANCCDNPYDQAHAEDCEMNKDPHQCCDSENHDPGNCERKTVEIHSTADYVISLSNNLKMEPVVMVLLNYIPVNYSFEQRENSSLISDYYHHISPSETSEVLSLLQSYLN